MLISLGTRGEGEATRLPVPEMRLVPIEMAEEVLSACCDHQCVLRPVRSSLERDTRNIDVQTYMLSSKLYMAGSIRNQDLHTLDPVVCGLNIRWNRRLSQ